MANIPPTPRNPRQTLRRDGFQLLFIRPEILADFAHVSRVQFAVGWGVSARMKEMKLRVAPLLPEAAFAEEDHLLAARQHDTEATYQFLLGLRHNNAVPSQFAARRGIFAGLSRLFILRREAKLCVATLCRL